MHPSQGSNSVHESTVSKTEASREVSLWNKIAVTVHVVTQRGAACLGSAEHSPSSPPVLLTVMRTLGQVLEVSPVPVGCGLCIRKGMRELHQGQVPTPHWL